MNFRMYTFFCVGSFRVAIPDLRRFSTVTVFMVRSDVKVYVSACQSIYIVHVSSPQHSLYTDLLSHEILRAAEVCAAAHAREHPVHITDRNLGMYFLSVLQFQRALNMTDLRVYFVTHYGSLQTP
jgi:hypothetical protein